MADRTAQRHLAVLDLDLDAARIEADIVGQAFGEFPADVRVGATIAGRLAHFGYVILGVDAIRVAHAQAPCLCEPTARVGNGLPAHRPTLAK